ncbi:hypothetical protein CCR75_000038 [Bremia lactucae]|uniref:Uncharacterized protein n=1 Tax=Bremia lactucae TaxID=4779 RepID=A0A976NZJ0_BRELC|nr:hypothetical protein CCR75_000038 [Bremia lactucae]
MARPQDLLPDWLVNHHVSGGIAPPEHIHLCAWDDKFTPSGCDERPGKIVCNFPRDHAGALAIIDDAISEETASQLYKSAVKATVWGVYVPISDLFPKRVQKEGPTIKLDELKDPVAFRQALARRAVQEFLIEKDDGQTISQNDWNMTHGVAVWVIASDCDDATAYHLDYAEQVRYETNVIFPPIYGATLHVSPFYDASETDAASLGREMSAMQGGALYVNSIGLGHYAMYGYKTRKHVHRLSTDELEMQSNTEAGWRRVSYRYRRGILCDGEFPHFSGRVRKLPTEGTFLLESGYHYPVKRVVVGFNLFPSEIGACVARFPEHSNAFNRYVKLMQAAVKQTTFPSTPSAASVNGNWTLESVRANPKQAAFLKLLARKVRKSQIQKAADQDSKQKVPSQQGLGM